MQKIKYSQEWVDGFWKKIEDKLSVTARQIGAKFPYTTTDGVYEEFARNNRISWWTNGFWPGMMWLMYLATKDEDYRDIAVKCEELLDGALCATDELHHDVGFMWLTSAVANYRITGDEAAKKRGVLAATLLAGRYNPNGQFLRAWIGRLNTGVAIIDCMMNIPIMYWASEVTGDPRFKDLAMLHADTAMNTFLRPDGSSNHIVKFNPDTGEVVETPGGQGYESGSSWSRGQSWALYGFTLSYIHTGKQEYLDAAKRSAHYFIANLDETGIPECDFRSPEEPVIRDTTAGAVAACGLIELYKVVPEFEKNMYLNGAIKILKGLETCCNFDLSEQSILQMGTELYHEPDKHHVPIIYGDYYLMEALLKLRGIDMLLW